MTARDPKLQYFLDLTEAAILVNADTCEGARPVATRIFTALRSKIGEASGTIPESLPICGGTLEDALRIAQHASAPVPDLAAALVKLAPDLAWRRRKGAELESGNFFDGHANAFLAGPDGIEIRSDVMIGISLMAPHMRYPDHRHPPEEVYVSLAGGAWKKDRDWHQPKPGDLIYNEPNVLHAMATEEKPLLAIWCLWTGDNKL
jgi:hypothetical protein